ncbi:RHS repeat domain-containing protein [Rhodococcus ruber]|uniref:RHS repeat domain-containing protein n=1 Tax=Rhodococcus ruber TaxID=1830 RepID=UPI0037844824
MARKIVTIDEETKALPAVAREAIDARIGAVGDPKYLSKTEASATYAPVAPDLTVTRDATGNVTGIDEDGITTTYTRDATGRIVSYTRNGVTHTVTRSAQGAIEGITA